eukprot:4249736-Pyramimonas_sp.AAC.1
MHGVRQVQEEGLFQGRAAVRDGEPERRCGRKLPLGSRPLGGASRRVSSEGAGRQGDAQRLPEPLST